MSRIEGEILDVTRVTDFSFSGELLPDVQTIVHARGEQEDR